MDFLRITTPLAAATLTLALFGASPPALAGNRAIADFTSRQGAWCPAFDNEGFIDCAASYYMPDNSAPCPGGGFTFPFDQWTDPKNGFNAIVDTTGDVNRLVGVPFMPQVAGSVSEAPLANGGADLGVVLHSSDAWMRVLDPNFEWVFGHGVGEVLDGASPTLGDALLQIRFTNTAPMAPLPDMSQLLICPAPGQTLDLVSLRARASGPLRPASGYPDGTPGRLEVTQTCLVATATIADGNSRVALDACPAESVIVTKTGQ
jgi:hypothetical protein